MPTSLRLCWVQKLTKTNHALRSRDCLTCAAQPLFMSQARQGGVDYGFAPVLQVARA
jgi:hypothetical protein